MSAQKWLELYRRERWSWKGQSLQGPVEFQKNTKNIKKEVKTENRFKSKEQACLWQKGEKTTSNSYLPKEALALVAKLVEKEEEAAEVADWLL